jgi:hypothetical protein
VNKIVEMDHPFPPLLCDYFGLVMSTRRGAHPVVDEIEQLC